MTMSFQPNNPKRTNNIMDQDKGKVGLPVHSINCDLFDPMENSPFLVVLRKMHQILKDNKEEPTAVAQNQKDDSTVQLRGNRLELHVSEAAEHNLEALKHILNKLDSGVSVAEFQLDLKRCLMKVTCALESRWETLSIIFSCGECGAQPDHMDFRVGQEEGNSICQIGLFMTPGGTAAAQCAGSQIFPNSVHQIWPHLSDNIKNIGDSNPKIIKLVKEAGSLFCEFAMRPDSAMENGAVMALQCNAIHRAPPTDQELRAVVFATVVPCSSKAKHNATQQWSIPSATLNMVGLHWKEHCHQLTPEDRLQLMMELFENTSKTMFQQGHAAFSAEMDTKLESVMHHDLLPLARQLLPNAVSIAPEQAGQFARSFPVQQITIQKAEEEQFFSDVICEWKKKPAKVFGRPQVQSIF